LEGESQRSIARIIKKARNTIAKYIRGFEKRKLRDVRQLPIPEGVMKPPMYKKRIGKKKVLTDEIKNKLRRFITDNK
jgi:hypothetical protein